MLTAPAPTLVAEVIVRDGRPCIRVKDHGTLVGKGYFDSVAEVAAALGDRYAELVITGA